MIGATFKSEAVQAVLGPLHSSVIPDVIYVAWLDTSLAVLGKMLTSHANFGATTDGVTNTASIDGGLAGSGWSIEYVAIVDEDDNVILAAATGTLTPAEFDPLIYAPGGLTFTIA